MPRFTDYLTENGRLIRVDDENKKLYILTKDSSSLPLWKPIQCSFEEGGVLDIDEFHLKIEDGSFPQLKRFSLETRNNTCHFVVLNNEKETYVHCLPKAKVKNDIAGCNLPADFSKGQVENQQALLDFLNDPKTIYQAASYVSKSTSTVTVPGSKQEFDLRQTPYLKALLDSEQAPSHLKLFQIDKIRQVSQLKAFAEKEISRLNHWYVWNGRAKAQAIRTALNTLTTLNVDDEKIDYSPVAVARESGLLNALSSHRHRFFSHSAKTQSHQSIGKLSRH